MKPFRIVVTGSRDWEDRYTIHRILESTIEGVMSYSARVGEVLSKTDIVIDDGGATGADSHARAFREENGYPGQSFKAEWATPPRKGDPAGPRRNGVMLRTPTLARLVVAFPLGDRTTSPGTWNCIEQGAVLGIPARVYPKVAR